MKKTLILCMTVLTLTGCSTLGNFFDGMFTGGSSDYPDQQLLQQHISQCDTGMAAECIAAGSVYELRGGDNYPIALKFYQKGLALQSADANQAIGHLYENGYGVPQNYDTARQWYQKGADAGDGNAMLYLANMYRYGHGVTKDPRTALKYARMACKKGNILACSTRTQLQVTTGKK
ncbi:MULTISPECIES: tetratricopeptide repeat protein [Tatumella]|uniref:Sel1 repeat family protein n=1 Tax=Tatumella punctata TaxID=399969 RepID=A0ABW1VSB6_9GAMM|nr:MULTISPECIES: tetratricopeptide repeat protein [unclassified Tatumella]MBS0857152.1 sel1 repeat family protein [Tatumella sp. JGM16]MBS0878519.1 sel1 repeat family protein [Tatumella sp. JGM82]MBS0892111.1 sel1 repeat family protein [Tatumella sp. JGM94]MBS0894034.1 sel1 repeat family protein [Tatumella sp. JGM130]MBS0903210.1 sel1 repeat family protein [Tatumella sp. JGM100]